MDFKEFIYSEFLCMGLKFTDNLKDRHERQTASFFMTVQWCLFALTGPHTE